MTKFKCANCGRIVKSAEGSVFTMEQIVKWNKQCKKCNEADMLEYYKQTACEKNLDMSNLFDGDVSVSVIGLIGVCQTSNDLSALFNLWLLWLIFIQGISLKIKTIKENNMEIVSNKANKLMNVNVSNSDDYIDTDLIDF